MIGDLRISQVRDSVMNREPSAHAKDVNCYTSSK